MKDHTIFAVLFSAHTVLTAQNPASVGPTHATDGYVGLADFLVLKIRRIVCIHFCLTTSPVELYFKEYVFI